MISLYCGAIPIKFSVCDVFWETTNEYTSDYTYKKIKSLK